MSATKGYNILFLFFFHQTGVGTETNTRCFLLKPVTFNNANSWPKSRPEAIF